MACGRSVLGPRVRGRPWSGGAPCRLCRPMGRGLSSAFRAIPSASRPQERSRPVLQIVEGEARVLGKTRSTLYAAAVLIVLTAALCVLATLTGWVFDRRRDFAIMKALGASERLVSGFFAAEAAAMGAVGAILGSFIG